MDIGAANYGDGMLQALKSSGAPGNSQLSSLGAGGYPIHNQQAMQGVALGQMALQVCVAFRFCQLVEVALQQISL